MNEKGIVERLVEAVQAVPADGPAGTQDQEEELDQALAAAAQHAAEIDRAWAHGQDSVVTTALERARRAEAVVAAAREDGFPCPACRGAPFADPCWHPTVCAALAAYDKEAADGR